MTFPFGSAGPPAGLEGGMTGIKHYLTGNSLRKKTLSSKVSIWFKCKKVKPWWDHTDMRFLLSCSSWATLPLRAWAALPGVLPSKDSCPIPKVRCCHRSGRAQLLLSAATLRGQGPGGLITHMPHLGVCLGCIKVIRCYYYFLKAERNCGTEGEAASCNAGKP